MKENNDQNNETETSEIKRYYSLNSDSFNDIKEVKNQNLDKKKSEESEEISKKDSFSSLNISNIDIPPINLPNGEYNNCKDIQNDIVKSNTDFIIRRYSSSNENNRYDHINDIYNDNFKFFSFVKDDYNEEDYDIVNNEITSRYDIEENDNNINKLDSDELNNCNINIYSNNNIFNDSLKYKNESDKFQNENIIKEKKNEKKFEIQLENNINNQKDKIDINEMESNITIIKKKSKEKDGKTSSQKIDDPEKMNKQRGIKFLNMTKQKKIFQKFLSVSVDTSCFYSLEDDMKILILNPKINYNYPFNKKERELE